MKFLETTFEEYIISCNNENLHNDIEKNFEKYPDELYNINNMIFYGPPGTGKYSQVLSFISKYSPSNLKYEKKICVNFNKSPYYYKISDIHIEIDMSLLGCNAKLLWHEIFINILDIINTNPTKYKIIVCKNFHEINNELLDIFYSYMQQSEKNKLKFIIISQQISFIPDTITSSCEVINICKPSNNKYSKITKNKNINKNEEINNIKAISKKISQINKHKVICDSILYDIYNLDTINFTKIRDKIYNLFIYDVNIFDALWYIVNDLLVNDKLNDENITDVLIKMYSFFKYYNNNYRPIYHVENIIFYLIKNIYNLEIKQI